MFVSLSKTTSFLLIHLIRRMKKLQPHNMYTVFRNPVCSQFIHLKASGWFGTVERGWVLASHRSSFGSSTLLLPLQELGWVTQHSSVVVVSKMGIILLIPEAYSEINWLLKVECPVQGLSCGTCSTNVNFLLFPQWIICTLINKWRTVSNLI